MGRADAGRGTGEGDIGRWKGKGDVAKGGKGRRYGGGESGEGRTQ